MGTYRFEPFGTPDLAVSSLRALIESADEEILLSASYSVLQEVRPALSDAIDRGVLVLLLVSGVEPREEAGEEFSDVARIVHSWDDAGPISVICTADSRDGLCASELVFDEPLDEDAGVVFSHPLLRTHLFSTVIGNTWNRAPEVYTGDPDSLPATYHNFPTAVINATLHLREGDSVTAEISGNFVGTTDTMTITGPVVNVRQSFVSPITNSFPVENSLAIRNDQGDVLTVGGPGAFVEDVEAHEITLRSA